MNSFISFENTSNQIEYFFSKYHFIVLLISLVIIVFFCMYATRQRFRFQKLFSIVSLILIALFECGRIVWRYFYLEHNSEELSFLNVTNLDFFTLSVWIAIPLTILGIIIKTRKKRNFGGLSFVFWVSTIIAVTNLIYPSFLNANFEFFHIYNLLSILIRSLIIMLGFFFVFAKWINIKNFLNLWRSFLSLLFFGIVCIIVYYILGAQNNLFYLEYVPLFETLGIYLGFPLQFILIGIFIFALQFLFFLPFYIYRNVKNKD